MQTIWEKWGFRANPLENHALGANKEGRDLLSGRSAELEQLKYILKNSNSWIPVSGNSGVGKTSLANVASYVLYEESCQQKPPCTLFLPCELPISVKPGEADAEFKNRVARIVLNSLDKYRSDLKNNHIYDIDSSLFSELDNLITWASTPVTGGKGAGVAGFSVQQTIAANTSSGYSGSFADQLFSLVEKFFPRGGGVICIIDNCEIYPDASALVAVLSSLRDDLFLRKGLKWVFCGALGILERLTDDRLKNFLSDNVVKVDPIKTTADVIDMINRRQTAFKIKGNASLPIDASEITELFGISGGNPRIVLAKLESYCLWSDYPGNIRKFSGANINSAQLFNAWRNEQIAKNVDDYSLLVTRKAWTIFERLDEIGGDVRPSFYSKFDCNSVPSFIQHLKILEEHGLVAKHYDDNDLRGTIYRITDKGRWTIYSWRNRNKLSVTLGAD